MTQNGYPARLATAYAELTAAEKALATARAQCELTTAFTSLALDRAPKSYADCLRKIADIVETIPALADAIPPLRDAYDTLYAQACHKCSGTGQYAGATGYHRRGVPYCFTCGGDGRGKAHRPTATTAH